MIWRSVVGKLWLTILLLVSVVLFFLTVLLLQFFENFHVGEAENQMKQIALKVSDIVSSSNESKESLLTSSEIVDSHSARAVIIGNDSYWVSPNENNLPKLPKRFFEKDDTLSRAQTLKGNNYVVKQGDFPIKVNGVVSHSRMMVVGVPIKFSNGHHGAVYVFQSLDVIQDTTNNAKKLIYISAFIAIILTTFFAFFLSTRITAPLRSMREAALQVSQGKFDTEVPVLTKDEIGELGTTFNRMAGQLKQNLTALNQEKEQLSGILESMADGVMTFDREGQLLILNPPAKRFLHAWRYEDGEGPAPDQKIPEPVQALFHTAVTTEKKDVAEVSYQGRSWVIVMTPLYDQAVVRGAVAVLRDMTEERQLDQLRKGFIANVSHELRTPIAMLQGYSEAIVDDVAETAEDKKEMAKIIYDESQRMGRLVNELLDLARLEAGHFQLNQTEVELGDFFMKAVHKFKTLAKEENILLTLNGPEHPESTLTFDPDRIEQVITNLVDNAIRHTSKNGTVTVDVEENENGVVVKVHDTGSGIAQEDLPFVFERFYKADKARTRGKSGTGLGLAIARNIVEAHEGKIIVNSKMGEGTTFTFFLPRKMKKPATI
ncbi:two-component system sensor histidine kinase ResE [Scopulibacillus darangshiensis]|uniref:histidine kinase n=1 Tax=Scopulibacillus darangshiensis TaxID=442528 RepID=A0A4V2SNM3_9BACL|nr:ATP-binding protein [Scopulibacillus darangshiensis]TCP31686.1 two-component system sensor histidine kinase ResE [Scopulibacillus darangshiensis]